MSSSSNSIRYGYDSSMHRENAMLESQRQQDSNSGDPYESMMGKPQPAHMGSQSATPEKE